MSIDITLCETAWLARDPAYDGAFFVCVRTTGIYCRCVCPVKQPLRRNCNPQDHLALSGNIREKVGSGGKALRNRGKRG